MGISASSFAARVASSRRATFVVASLMLLVVAGLTFANTSDDPLVTLRYASNLLHHGQPVYNLGEHVEGYSSPLHLLLATAVLLVPGGAVLLKLKLASLLFAVGTLWQTGRLSRATGAPRWAELAVMVAAGGSWNLAVSSSNGLETSLVAFLATGAAASLASQDSLRQWWRPALWTGALAISRPDAVLTVAALAAVALWSRRELPIPQRVYWLVGPAVTLGGLLSFRVAYYDALLPNTYYAKQIGLSASISLGWLYLKSVQPLSGVGAGVVVLASECWLVLLGARRFMRTRPAVGYALAILVAQVVFVFASGGDWMKGGRFLVPAIPAATVLIFSGVEAALASGRGKGAGSRRRLILAVLAVLAVLLSPVSVSDIAPAWHLSSGVSDRSLIASGGYALGRIWVRAVKLADCLRAGQSVAYSEAGLFGYEHLRLRVIDTRGLTDTEIARESPRVDKHLSGVTDLGWWHPTSTVGRVLLTNRPQMIISFDDSKTDWPGAWILHGLYRRAEIIPEPSPDRTLLVYIERGFECSTVS
jgi:hypothetical protein